MPSVVPFVHGRPTVADDTDSSLLPRPALLAALSRAVHDPVTVLQGPAGSGKSVLIAHLYQHLQPQQAVTWLALDAFDSDPAHFFQHLCLAIRHALPDFDGFSSLQRYGVDSSRLAVLAMNVLVDALLRVEQPLLIMMDKFEQLAGLPWLPVLRQTFALSPPNVRWLLSGRNMAGMEPRHWSQDDRSPVFTPEQLYFDREETRQMLQAAPHNRVPDSWLNSLYHHTRGWPAAVKLAQIHLKTGPSLTAFSQALSGNDVFHSLFKSVLANLDSELQRFLVQTSFLEHLSIPLCNHLLNIQNSADHIRTLRKLALLIEPDPLQGDEFRYHSLLQDHLLMLFRQLPPTQRDRLIARACLWRVEQNQREIACRVAWRHGQPAFFVELLRQSLREWLRIGEADPVYRWARQQGDSAWHVIPEVRFALGWALAMFGEFREAEKSLQLPPASGPDGQAPQAVDVASLFRQANTPQTVTTTIIFAIIRQFRGEMDAGLLDQLQRLYSMPSVSNTSRASIDNLLAQEAIHQCRFREARQRAGRAAQVLASGGNRLGHALGTYLMANAHYLNNDLKNAKITCQSYLADASQHAGSTARALLHGFSVFLDYQGHQPLTAERGIQQILLTRQPVYSVELQLYLTLPLLHMKTRRQDYSGAHYLLLQLEEMAHTGGASQLQAHALYERVRLAFAMGHGRALARLDAEHQLMRSGSGWLLAANPLPWEILERKVMAAVLVAIHQGDLVRASQWLQQLQYLNVDAGYPIRFLPLNLCLAHIEFRLGRISTAFRRLNDTLTQAEATGMLTGLLDDIPGMESFVLTAIAQDRIQNPQHVEKLRALGILQLPTLQDEQDTVAAPSALNLTAPDLSADAIDWHRRQLHWRQDQGD